MATMINNKVSLTTASEFDDFDSIDKHFFGIYI